MHSVTLKNPSFSPISQIFPNPNPNIHQFRPKLQNPLKFRPKSLNCYRNSTPNLAKSLNNSPILSIPSSEIDKIRILSSEFRALREPIERVKRLLHYAGLLEPLDETGRIGSNRVTGCTTQVWLEAKMDSEGLMRFRADSDSEITKGFCYCLVWALDRATPEEVMVVAPEDLADMNVGFFSGSGATSRVNTWQNVLASMQKRTKALVEERNRERGLDLNGFQSLLAKIEDLSPKNEERIFSPEVAQLS